MVVWSYALCRRHYPIPYDLRRIGEYFAVTVAIYAASEYGLQPLGESIHLAGNIVLFTLAICFAIWREKIDIKALMRAVTGKLLRR